MNTSVVKKLTSLFALLAAPLALLAANGPDTWVGNTSANLGDANWTGVNNPPLSGDAWLFGVAGTSGTNLNNTLTALNSVAGITFKGGASGYTLTNNSITLTGDVLNSGTSLETINVPINSTAVRTFTTTGTGGGNLVLGGVFSGSGGGITKAGPGTLTLNGTAANTYNGPTTVTGGSLIEDFANAAAAVNLIDPSSVLTLGGGTFAVRQKSATATSQTFASTTINPGFTIFTNLQVASGALTVALGAITQNVGGTVDFTNAAGGTITTTTANVNGILGGWATEGDGVSSATTGDWAANDGSGNIIPLPLANYTSLTGNQAGTGASAQNWRTTGNVNLTASATINSLQQNFDFILNSGVTLTLGSGGLMLKGVSRWLIDVGSSQVNSGEFITSGLGTGELYVHVPNAGGTDWRIWPIIQDGPNGPLQLIKDGPGFVALQNYNTHSGGTVVNGGTLALFRAATGTGVGDIRGNVTVNLGATLSCTAVNAFGYLGGARITNAIINGGTLTTSAAGDSAYDCVFNLTGGTLTSNGGASSSAATSYWVLGQDTPGNGGVSGINTFPSTLTSVIAGRVDSRSYNANGNVNEVFNVASGNTPNGIDLLVSAAITCSGNGGSSGIGGITKAGAGSMLLTGANTFPGGMIGNGGTLVIGNNAAFGNGGVVTMNSGAISNNTGGNFTVVNPISLASTTAIGVNTNDLLTLAGIINNTGGLTKVGNGTLWLTANNTYSGLTTVGAGRLLLSASQPNTGAITVNDNAKLGVMASGASHVSPTSLTVGSSTGATLEFAASSTTQAPLTPGTLTLTGVNKISVVAGSFAAGNSYPLVTYTTLAGGGSYTTGTLPNGVAGTITTVGNTITLTVTAVTNTVWTGAVNGTWDIATTANWITNGVAGVYVDGSPVQFDDTGLNTATITNVSGTLSPASILVNNTAKNYAIKVAIGGTGGLTKSGTGSLTNSGANTYTGPTVINDGNVVAGVATVALGNNSAVSIANTATAAINMNGFATQLGSLTGGGTAGGNVTNGGALLTVGGDNTSPAAYAGVISGTGGLTKIGSGTLTLSGTNAFTGATTVAGTLNVPGALGVGTGTMTVGNVAGINSIVNVSGMGITNNNYNIATVPGAVGAIYQTAGNVRASAAAAGSNFQIGNATNAFGYYDAAGGTLTMNELGVGGESGASGNAIFDLNGGTVTNGGWLVMARGGLSQTAVLNSYSGTLYYNNAGGGGLQCNWGAGGQTCIINMLGGAVLNIGSVNNPINLNQSGNVANLGILNCDGGTISAGFVNGGANGTRVNFNGGTLAANENQAVFMTGLAAATVYGAGGIINNNGFSITISQQFIAPAGNGVNSIASFTGGAGYIAPPIVTVVNNVSDSTGVGATAIAQINPATGTVTNVLITCPGVNYTATPTFTVTGGGATTPATITGAAPTANTSGGLTFTGSGTTALTSGTGTYTYTGPTLVTGGTLALNPLLLSVTSVTVTNAGLAVDATSGTPLAINSVALLNNATNTFSYGTVTVNPTTPAINITSLSAPGSGLVINISAFGLLKGQFPLIQYGGSLASIANFSLGALPPGVVASLSNNVASSTIDIVISGTGQNLSWYGLLPDGVNVSSNWDITLTTNWVAVGTTTPALRYQEYTASGTTVGDPVTFDDSLFNSQATNINLATPVRPFQFFVNSTLPYSFSSASSVTNGLTGLGGILKSNTGSLTLLTSNSFTGGLSVNDAGAVVITNDFSLGASAGPVTLNGSTLQVNGTTTNNVRAFSVPVTASIGVANNAVARFGGSFSGAGGLTKTDNGTLTLAGTNGITGTLTARQGTLITLGTNAMPAVVRVADTAGLNGVLNVSGGNFKANNNGGQFASSLTVGSVSGGAGDLQLSGGTLTIAQQLGLGTGVGGYAGFNMTGGTLACGSYVVVGFNTDMAVYNQSGGNVTLSSNLMTIGAGGTASIGVANISGGTFNASFPASSGIMVGERGEGTLNVSGGAVITVTNNAGLDIGPSASQTGWRGRLNLNGGTVIANRVAKGVGTGTALLGLNGGTIQASAANATFVSGIDKATVYANGVTIDDGGFAITIPQPLLAPTGSGLATIAVTGGSSGYIDIPIVTITDGAGLGSNAMATATVSGGAVTGLVITSPGNGFDPVNSSINVAFAGGGASPTPPGIGAVTYSGNASGGLTHRGTGTLALTGVNTFSGPITNNGGALSLTTASTNSGAAINAGSLAVTTASKFTGSVTVSNGASLTMSQVGSATNTMGNLTFNGGAAIPGATLGLGLTGLNPTVALVTCGTLTINGTNTLSISGAVSLGTIPLIKYTAFAGTGTYTNTTLPQGVGGYVSNSLANSTLYVVITSTGPGLVWTGFNTNAALTNLWNISSATNWLLGATLTTYQQPIIPGDAVTFNDSGSGTVILNTNVGPSSLVISNNSKSYTFSGSGTVSGSTGMQKLGAGTAVLNLTNSSYTGDTVIGNGTLQAGSASAISPSAGLSVSAAGKLQLAGFSQSVNALSGTGLIDNSSTNAIVLTAGNGGGAVNWSGTITNTGTGGASFIKTGSGNSTVTGTNYLAAVAASQNNGGTMLITNGGTLHLPGGAEFWVMQNAGTATVIVDGGFIDLANWLVVGRNNAAANGTLILNSGLIQKGGGGNVVVGSLNATGNLIVNGGQLLNNSELWLGESPAAVATLHLNGGLVQAVDVRENNNGGLPTVAGVAYFNGGTLQAIADSADFIQTPVVANVMNGGLVLDDSGFTLTISSTPLLDGDSLGGGLFKKGSGTVYLDANNTYTGMTVVTNGTVAGAGTVAGPVVVTPAGNLGAGNAAAIGFLTINNNLALQGNATLRVSKTGGTPAQDQVVVSGNINYGGVLTVTNATSDANVLTTSDSFPLFSVTGSKAGNFTSISGSPGAGLAYSFDPATGILSIVAQTISPNPTNVTFTVTGNTLTLGWPEDHRGWFLQAQTNTIGTGLSNNWFDIPGSDANTNAVITINPANPDVFYRLRHP